MHINNNSIQLHAGIFTTKALTIIPAIIYIPLLCLSSIFHDSAPMQVINAISSFLAIFHISYISVHADVLFMFNRDPRYSLVKNFLFLYETHIRQALWLILFIASSAMYHHIAFVPYICNSGNATICDVIDKVIRSSHVVFGMQAAVQLAIVFFYVYTFISSRMIIWTGIVDKERALGDSTLIRALFSINATAAYCSSRKHIDTSSVDGSLKLNVNDRCENDETKETWFSRFMSLSTTHNKIPPLISKSFITQWTTCSNAELIRRSSESASTLYNRLVKFADANNDGCIGRREFDNFASEHGMSTEFRDKAWALLSASKKSYHHQDYDYGDDDADDLSSQESRQITLESISTCLNELDFERRKFAYMIATDNIVVKWIRNYASIILHGLGTLIVLAICGYKEVFNSTDASVGLDLLKIFILGLTYLLGVEKDQIRFLFLMIRLRPYNIGDLVLFRSQPCVVRDITSSFTKLEGSHNHIISNESFSSQPGGIENLSTSRISDSFKITVPVNNFATCARLRELLEQYSGISGEITNIRVDPEPLDGDSKSARLCWKYRYNIFDRSEYNLTRSRITNYIVDNIAPGLSSEWMKYMAASGGAYNEEIAQSDPEELKNMFAKKTV